ncbi:MAG TPA: DUF4340 domain-containing protein [Dokdonella sp.]|nr:DUF4340 domain-containing protein [Dokdonella sp.]
MMNKKSLVKLGVVTGVAVAAAFAINHSRQPVREFSARADALVEGLGEHVNDVSRLSLTTANKQKAVELAHSDNGWKVASKGGYPADVGKLREFLLKVADASLIEQKTANKERYADLGVSDISEPAAKGIEVEIDGLAKPVVFIAGNFNAQAAGTYVRRSDEAQSWLAKGNLIPDKNAADWLQKDLANIPSERIASVAITQPDGKTLRVFKNAPDDAHYTIADLPKGREASSEFAANGLASVLADLRIDDVAPATEVAAPEHVTRIRYQTFDGVVVDASEWQVGDKHHVTFSASFDSEMAAKHIAAEQARVVEAKAKDANAKKPEEVAGAKAGSDNAKATPPADEKAAAAVDPARDREQRLAALKAEVDALNASFQGWTFVLPAYKSGNMTKSMDDMLKPLDSKAVQAPAKKAGKPG